MIIEIKAPSPGESITEVQLAKWLVANGDIVAKDVDIAEVDSDKATLTVNAEIAGKITLYAKEGDTVPVGAVIATIESGFAPAAQDNTTTRQEAAPPPASAPPAPELKPPAPAPQPEVAQTQSGQHITFSPLARKLMEEKNLSGEDVLSHVRITRSQVQAIQSPLQIQTAPQPPQEAQSDPERKKMSPLRLKLAERLVNVKNQTAMLTTFNEVNMRPVMNLRKIHNEAFKEKHGIGLGFMSFFTKAVTIALQKFPQVNAQIDGDEMVFFPNADIGIAVSAPKGLVVPVIRRAETLSLAAIELRVRELATKARDNKITLDEMSGGSFTITNGGVFGSMMSTPILNPPQSAILGMHNIVERPIAVDGQVVVAPMMYLALSYDHRVIDGRESVGFLVTVKELIENPLRMLFEGNDPAKALLEI